MVSKTDLRKMEAYLKAKVLPALEQGRPHWDRPHTIEVVKQLKALLKQEPDLAVDEAVLLVAAYTHDLGYAGLFKDGFSMAKQTAVKPLHMVLGAKMVRRLLKEPVFSYLSPAQKRRIVHLVSVHDKVEELKDLDELILMEVDTLGALAAGAAEGHNKLTKADNGQIMQQMKRRRLSRFVTGFAKKEGKKLFARRQRVYQKLYGK